HPAASQAVPGMRLRFPPAAAAPLLPLACKGDTRAAAVPMLRTVPENHWAWAAPPAVTREAAAPAVIPTALPASATVRRERLVATAATPSEAQAPRGVVTEAALRPTLPAVAERAAPRRTP